MNDRDREEIERLIRQEFHVLPDAVLRPERKKAIERLVSREIDRQRGARLAKWRRPWWFATALASCLVIVALVLWTRPTSPLAHPSHPGNPETTLARPRLQFAKMISNSDGWAITTSDQIVVTPDGGLHWNRVTPKGMRVRHGFGGVGAEFLDASQAWVAVTAGDGTTPTLIYHTTDGGRSWTVVSTTPAYGAQFDFISASTGFLFLHEGAGMGSEAVTLLRTTDGGANWKVVLDAQATAQNPSLVFGGNKSGVSFSSLRDGWITGDWAASAILLYSTRDGGSTWTSESVPVPSGLSAQDGAAKSLPPAFFGPSSGVMPVLLETTSGRQAYVFYRTNDGGQHWQPTNPITPSGILLYSIVNPTVIVASDGEKLYWTSDGGATWSSRPSRLEGVTSLQFTSAMRGWALVHGALEATTTGGRIWAPVTPH